MSISSREYSLTYDVLRGYINRDKVNYLLYHGYSHLNPTDGLTHMGTICEKERITIKIDQPFPKANTYINIILDLRNG